MRPPRSALAAILAGGLGAGLGDSLLALILYRLPMSVIYQSVATGLLGRAAFRGGWATAGLGLVLHFSIATLWAAVYLVASHAVPDLARRPVASGLGFGALVYFFMKYVVLPLSAVPRLGPFDPWALLGHMLLVGLPIALLARRAAPIELG